MKHYSKQLLIVLFIVCTGAMLFAGGGGQQPVQGAGAKPVLEIGLSPHANVINYDTNYLTQYLENLHNVKLNFYHLPTDGMEARTKVALLVASGSLPDTIWGNFNTREQILEYGSNGAFISLNKYFSDPAKTPEFNKIPQNDRTKILKDSRSADGNNYSFPQYSPELWDLTPYRMYINRAWLAKLGLEEPKTTDQLKNVLTSFRDRDPNGNGKKDEIGVYGWFNGGYGQNVIAALINSFIYWNGNIALDVTGNNVIAPIAEPGFRKALQYLNSLFKDGLLDAQTFTNDNPTFRATLNLDPAIVGFTSMGSSGNFVGKPAIDDNPNYLAMAPILAPLSSPDCPGYSPYTDYTPFQIAFISSNCKNSDLAVKLMDSFYSEKLTRISRFGEEGVDWTTDPAILANDTNAMVYLGVYPKLTMTQINQLWFAPFNKHWMGVTPRYSTMEMGGTYGDLNNPIDPNKPTSMERAVNYQALATRHPQFILPQLQYNAADGVTLSRPITDIGNYVRQSIAEFTIGTRDINNDAIWNAYQTELNNMGLKQWLNIAQATYNRQK